MKSNHILPYLIAVVLCGTLLTSAKAQGTAFVYQGRINDGGNPANGNYDMTFSLYSVPSGGTQVGSTITALATGVTNGIFSLPLDFGPVYNGGPLYLQVGLKTNASSTYTNLPRQSFASTPYAVYAINASNLLGTLSANQLPTGVVTNNSSNLTLSGTFNGNGAGLTSVPAFVVTNNEVAAVTLNGTFSGNGTGLTSVPAFVVTNNEVAAVTLNGTFSGSGAGLTSLAASALTGGPIPSSVLSGTYSSALNLSSAANKLTAASISASGALIASNQTTGGFNGYVTYIHNTATGVSNGPALRVVNQGGTNMDGALSVSANVVAGTNNGLIAEFGNADSFVCVITNDGSIYTAGTVTAQGTKLTSDRFAKRNFTPLNPESILQKVAAMPISEWNFNTDPSTIRHIGPVAQDFHSAFGLDGDDDRHISVVDEGGVALAAIQGLNEKLDHAQKMIQERDATIADLEKRMGALEQTLRNANVNTSH